MLWIPTGIGILAFVGGICALFLPFWAKYYHSFLGEIHYGLWKTCYFQYICISIESTSVINDVRKLEIAGIVLIGLSVLFGVLALFGLYRFQKNYQVLTASAGGLAILSGLVMLIGDLVFAVQSKAETNAILIANKKVENYYLYYVFYVSIVLGVLSVLTGCLFCGLTTYKRDRVLI